MNALQQQARHGEDLRIVRTGQLPLDGVERLRVQGLHAALLSKDAYRALSRSCAVHGRPQVAHGRIRNERVVDTHAVLCRTDADRW